MALKILGQGVKGPLILSNKSHEQADRPELAGSGPGL